MRLPGRRPPSIATCPGQSVARLHRGRPTWVVILPRKVLTRGESDVYAATSRGGGAGVNPMIAMAMLPGYRTYMGIRSSPRAMMEVDLTHDSPSPISLSNLRLSLFTS